MPEHVNCNLCKRDESGPLFTLKDYRLHVDEVEWQAVRCRVCGLGYLDPRPTPEELKRYYPAAYFDSRGDQMPRYRRQSAFVSGSPGRLLDIGTANGHFLKVMHDLGWAVEGIEPSGLAGNPHGLPIHHFPFPDGCDLPAESFDTITAWAVFEHLADPRSAFEVCTRLLRPGGQLIVQVPNLRSIWARFALQEDVPRHLHFFDPSTLAAYGTAAGLTPVKIVHTTDLFGGSGRGVLRLWAMRASGLSLDEFFAMWSMQRRERFRHRPLRTLAWTVIASIEEVVLADALVRALRLSGQVVAIYRKPSR